MVTTKSRILANAQSATADSGRWIVVLNCARDPRERAFVNAAQTWVDALHADGVDVVDEGAWNAAGVLAELGFDVASVVAALLLGAIRRGDLTHEVIAQKVGAEVAVLIDGALRMSVIERLHDGAQFAAPDQDQREALRRLLLAMANDVRVVVITLAECVARLRGAKSLERDEQRRIAREAMDIYAPLANRLGMWQVKWELEDLALRYLEPEQYKEIARLLDERRVDREKFLANFISELQTLLAQAGVKGEVKGRPKHIYSIWKKMQRKNVGFNEIFDIRAVRVMVPTVADCYTVLGIVHSHWNYVRSEFDDYIAAPKENMYQSLHTAVVGTGGKVVEVQIRTPQMHEHAELGVAAHWRYKEGANHDITLERKLAWLRQLLEWKDTVATGSELLDRFKDEAFSDRIYVFTPKGKIIDLPTAATPLDFAYHIHSDVGHRCRGAKVSGKMVPLTHALHNGDVVEILTVKQGGPSRDWVNPHLGYLKSGKARDKVLQWFKQQHYDDNVHEGRALLEKELHRLGFVDVNLEKLAHQLHFDKSEKMFAALGRGEVKPMQIVHALQQSAPPPEEKLRVSAPPKDARRRKDRSNVFIQGVGNLLTNFARCCKPIPGDPVVGYITQGRGVTIHRSDCANVLRYRSDAPERLIEVQWGAAQERTYAVDVYILAYDRAGLLRDITSVLANEKINVTATRSISDKLEHQAHITLTLEIHDLTQLSRVLAQINQLPNVVVARRQKKG